MIRHATAFYSEGKEVLDDEHPLFDEINFLDENMQLLICNGNQNDPFPTLGSVGGNALSVVAFGLKVSPGVSY